LRASAVSPTYRRQRRRYEADIYADLAEKLAAIGVKDTERNIANKISRGAFTGVFFLQCMEALGVQTVHLAN
jgi:hypothetical protein